MKKISRRSFLAVCGAMAATAALTACASASTAGTTASGSTAGSAAGSAASGEVFELKLSTTQTDTSMIYQGLQAAADKVAEDTDGHVKVTIYPSSQLGGEEDMIDQALQGMGIAVLTDAGRLSSYVNDIGIMNMEEVTSVLSSRYTIDAIINKKIVSRVLFIHGSSSRVVCGYNKTLKYAQMVLGGEIEHYLSLSCDHGRLEEQ